MKAGAVEFLTKPFRDQDLLDAIQQAIDRGRTLRSRELEAKQIATAYESLTPREREVLRYVIRGLVNKQIASEMGITESTVKLHRGRLMHKMKAESVPDLVRMAEKIGVIEGS